MRAAARSSLAGILGTVSRSGAAPPAAAAAASVASASRISSTLMTGQARRSFVPPRMTTTRGGSRLAKWGSMTFRLAIDTAVSPQELDAWTVCFPLPHSLSRSFCSVAAGGANLDPPA